MCCVLCVGGTAGGWRSPWGAAPLPRAGHSQLRVPCTAAAGKTCSERAKSCTSSQDWGEKMSPTALPTPRAEKSKGRRPGELVFPCSLGGDPQEQSSTLGPLGNTTAEQVSIPRGNYGIWRAHAEARKRCEKEGVAERNCCWYVCWYGLTPAPIPIPSVGQKEGGVKLRLWKRGQEGGVAVFVYQNLSSNYFFPMAVKVNGKCPYVVPYLYIVPWASSFNF